jgi:hypothetical protein
MKTMETEKRTYEALVMVGFIPTGMTYRGENLDAAIKYFSTYGTLLSEVVDITDRKQNDSED